MIDFPFGERIVVWNLSAGEHVLNARATINNSVRAIMLHHPAPPSLPSRITAISCDLNYIVALWQVGDTRTSDDRLDIYDSTGNHRLDIYDSIGNPLMHTIAQKADELWITPDGCEVRFLATTLRVGGWKIIKDGNSNVIGLEPLPENMYLRGRYLPGYSPSYSITDDGWILNLGEERLMWLPPHWRRSWYGRRWYERFLGLVNGELQEPIIVELGEWPARTYRRRVR